MTIDVAKQIDRMAVVPRLVSELIPYARNARTHSEHQVKLIAGAIREFGFTNPVLLDGNSGIIAGHGRVMAAQKLGLSKVPTIDLSHLTEGQRRAYILADNKLALLSGWDDSMLAMELGDIATDGEVDLSLTGFDEKEMKKLLGDADDGPADSGDGPIDQEAYTLVIDFPNEQALAAAFEEAKQRGWQCKIMT